MKELLLNARYLTVAVRGGAVALLAWPTLMGRAPAEAQGQPPISTVLERTGGIDGVRRRVGTFLEMALS